MRYYKLLLSTTLFIILMLCNSFEAEAQARKKMPNWEARAGIGLLPTFLKDHTRTELQPVSLELRYRPNQKFSIGLLTGMSVSQAMQEHHTGETRTVRNNFQMFAIRTAIHSNPFERWEVYGGTTLGYTNSDVTYTDGENPKTGNEGPSFFPEAKERDGLLFSAFLGTNYRVYKNVSLFGEISYGLSLATAGVAVRF
ncbi:MAG: outer membrane beta-barrel protein [Bacteroidota bacterium]